MIIKKVLKQLGFVKRPETEMYPDEIFLDAHNLPQFDTTQMEGRMEKPISRGPIWFLSAFMLCVACIFIYQLWNLQVVDGARYADRAENNRLQHTLVFAERGLVYDRNNVPLIWNIANASSTDYSLRKYTDLSGLSHILGYLKYPAKDKGGFYYREEMEGVSGVENYYNDILKGTNGVKIIETNAVGAVQSESIINPPVHGAVVNLSVDAELQSKLYEYIGDLAHRVGFLGGAGVIMDVHTGEVLAMTSYPEYSSQVMTDGTDRQTIASYNRDTNFPFLDKVTSGLYTPGSIVKPFMGVAILEEGVISPTKQILSTGSLKLENPYVPGTYTVFNDWKAHGYVDLRRALAVSSDVYFYAVGGGFEDQKGIGIENIARYMKLFGFGEDITDGFFKDKKGVVPTPAWKEANFDGEPWRIGNTYHTAIGQYGFQVTPIQAVRAIAALANDGWIVEPTILASSTQVVRHKVPVNAGNIEIVKEGMRDGVTEGIATALNVPYVTVAAKTGTAELGITKQQVNSWITGFFPYENPKYAFAVVMEKGHRDNLTGSVFVMRNLLDWMRDNRSEYFK